ncbi:hypothetical protein [Cellulomonas persica]|uniref:Uncharacterized protein n=1 Tax=Cellulomonas persica TaxID=76861 RepID=A0A510UTZ2_9CELL|nr:hypothetical protein [Cellulomonas persica]GEK18153.1 hypothetical protein CPE01_18860 [Cellulomonas persica]
MGWFSRRRDDDTPAQSGDAPDDALAPLTRADADWLRGVAAEAFAGIGVPGVAVRPDHLVDADGKEYGLTNLAAILAQQDRGQWQSVVDGHVASLALARERAGATYDEVADLLVARVMVEADLPRVVPAAGPQLGGGLCVRAAIDYPEAVSILYDDTRVGGWDVTGEAALAGLRTLPAPMHETLDHDVHLFEAPDFFGASRVLVHDELLDSVGLTDRPFGTLVVLPSRAFLAVHVLRDATVVHALHLMAQLGKAGETQPGTMSPHVYYRSTDGTLQQVTQYTDDKVDVVVDGAFARAMHDARLID